MISYFALSIILLLSFSVLVQFSNSPDFTITSKNTINSIDRQLVKDLEKIQGIDQVYARKSQSNINIKVDSNPKLKKADLIGYDNFKPKQGYSLVFIKEKTVEQQDFDSIQANLDYNYIFTDKRNKELLVSI